MINPRNLHGLRRIPPRPYTPTALQRHTPIINYTRSWHPKVKSLAESYSSVPTHARHSKWAYPNSNPKQQRSSPIHSFPPWCTPLDSDRNQTWAWWPRIQRWQRVDWANIILRSNVLEIVLAFGDDESGQTEAPPSISTSIQVLLLQNISSTLCMSFFNGNCGDRTKSWFIQRRRYPCTLFLNEWMIWLWRNTLYLLFASCSMFNWCTCIAGLIFASHIRWHLYMLNTFIDLVLVLNPKAHDTPSSQKLHHHESWTGGRPYW